MQQFRASGVAIVFVSHHLPAVAQLCSQVLLLEAGRPLRMGAPGDVIAAYCRNTGASDGDEVTIAATLRATRRAGVDAFEIEPGEQLTLDVTLEFHLEVERATVGIVVWDLTRELYVYGASSDFIGIPFVQADAGETKQFTFSFDANLTRGLYALEVNVVDFDRHRFLGLARGIRHFQVVEHVSSDGVANLYLKGRELSARTARSTPLQALAR
jgi:lipopolysaccharide transport system ATP-binding protein